MRYKLLFYTHALAGGGAERVWVLLASAFACLGCDVIFAVDYQAAENLTFLSNRVRLVVLGKGHVANVGRLARLLRQERPDVTFSALSANNLKHALAAHLAGRGGHAVISYHGYSQNETGLVSRLGYLATPLLTRLTACTVCVSDGLRRHLIRDFFASPRRLKRIYNPVFAPTEVGPREGGASAPIVLSVGRLVPEKDHKTLLRAFQQVRRRDAKLVLLGEGPERASLEREIAALGLEDRVELRGYVAEPWEAYAAASCFVLSSRVEAFGLVLVEAMAQGLPVVSTDCDGPREILEGGAHGRIVPIGDAAAMAQAIDEAIDEALASRVDAPAHGARAKVFSVDAATDAYRRVIDFVRRGADARRA